MSQKFPSDEFDSAPPHGGRHRARRTKRDRVIEFLRVMAVAAIFGFVALFGLRIADGSVVINPADLIDPSPVATSTVKSTPVTVLDGTSQVGLASKVAHELLDAGWNVITADNLNPTAPIAETKIYITSQDFDAATKTLVKTLGKYSVEVSGQYADPITVVLGDDYK